MSEQRDQRLQALFADTNESLVDGEFTKQVMLLTRKRKMQWYFAGAIVAAVVLVIASQFLLPLQMIAILITDVLSIELVSLGNSTAAWFLTPVNNLATLLVILAKGIRMSWKKVRQASYAS